MKKNILLIVLIVFISSVNAQTKVIPNNPDYQYQSGNETTTQTVIVQKTKPIFQPFWSFGGNFGLAFWNGGTDILIAPKAYYHISPQFFTGLGISYLYSNSSSYYQNVNYDYSSNSFGGSVMIGYRPIQFLLFSAEYEGLSTNYSGYYKNSYWNNAIYLGASFVTGPVSFGIRYDVLYDTNQSVYSSAWTPIIGFYF